MVVVSLGLSSCEDGEVEFWIGGLKYGAIFLAVAYLIAYIGNRNNDNE
jgi:hypothetical protein